MAAPLELPQSVVRSLLGAAADAGRFAVVGLDAESRVVGSVVRLKVKNLVGLGDSSRLFQKLVDRIEQSLEGVGRKHLPDGQVAILVKRFDLSCREHGAAKLRGE